MASPNGSGQGLTLAVLGAGSIGTAILEGLLASLSQAKTSHLGFQPSREIQCPDCLPSKILATVDRPESVARVQGRLSKYGDSVQVLQVLQGQNLKAVQDADVILLACKPHRVPEILAGDSMRSALAGKLLLSICVGLSADSIANIIYASEVDSEHHCCIVHAMPNAASIIQQSATVIASPKVPLSPEVHRLAICIFGCIGTITYQPVELMDAASVVAAATPAFFANVLEGTIDGAIAQGMAASDATRIAASAMKGAAELVLAGHSPSRVQEMIVTPQGSTAKGLSSLNDGHVRQIFANAVDRATLRIAEMKQMRPN